MIQKKGVALDSQQAGIMFSGAGGETVSRKNHPSCGEQKESPWPALKFRHRTHDGCQTSIS